MAGNDEEKHQPGRMDRRGIFRGAAHLGGLAALGLLTPAGPFRALAAEPQDPGATEALSAQTQRVLRWTGPNPQDWVPPRADVDHNVVIVGGGQTGVSIAYALGRKGIGRVQVIDQAAPGEAGIWRTIARMRQLRTPKTLPGPAQANAALGFRAWYETLYGPGAFDALDRIPRLVWADYLAWFQQVCGTQVLYRTRLLDIEPMGDVLRLQLESGGVRSTQTTRKLILANGYAGAGGDNVPDFLRALPASVWTHTERPIRFEALTGKVVGVLGAGASAFDAAATALEHGASEVHLFSRRAYINYTNAPPSTAPSSATSSPPAADDRGYPSLVELSFELPDEIRWRNQLMRARAVASVPLDSLGRAVASDKFYLHLNSSWSDVAMAGDGKVSVKAAGETYHFDHVIAGTGYRIDLSAQSELAGIHDSIALWRDRFQPGAGEQNAASGIYPYLGSGFQFLARGQTGAGYLRNIHCVNLAANLSFGMPVGDVPSMVLQPRLVAAIAQDLFLEGINAAANKRLLDAPPPSPPDPAPYARAIR